MPESIKCIHQCCDLFVAQRLYRRTPCLRQITNVGRIGTQIADQHSLLQSAVQDAVDFLDSFSRQPLCKHLVDKFLHQHRCDCIETVPPQKRLDVIFAAVSVGTDRKRRASSQVFLQPDIHPFRKLHCTRRNIFSGIDIACDLPKPLPYFFLRSPVNRAAELFAVFGICAYGISTFPSAVFSHISIARSTAGLFRLCHNVLLAVAHGFRCYKQYNIFHVG